MIKILTAWWLFMASDSLPHTRKYHIPYAYSSWCSIHIFGGETKVCAMCVPFFGSFALNFFYRDFQFFDDSSNSESSCVILTFRKKKVERFLVGQPVDRFYFAYNKNINLRYKRNAKLRWRQMPYVCIDTFVGVLLIRFFTYQNFSLSSFSPWPW